MAADVILSIDQGTTSVRASVLNAQLDVLAVASRTVPRSFPQPGWVELDAGQVVEATRMAIAEVLRRADCTAAQVAAMGFANQGETVVVWDRATGKPCAPAVVWQCRRTESRCEELRRDRDHATMVRKATGLPIDPYFSATKIAWLLDNVPNGRARAENGELCAGTLDAFTIFSMSNGRHFVTDPSTACRTQLAPLSTGRFDEALCRAFAVPSACLPRVVPSDLRGEDIYVDLDADGRSGAVRVGALLCDQPSALLGTGCLGPGEGKCTYGTGAFLQINVGDDAAIPDSDDGLLRSIAWERRGARTYLLEGSVLAAGDVLTWLRDGLGLLAASEDVERILTEHGSGHGVAFLPTLTGLGAPGWVGDARGLVVGLHRGTQRDDVVYAALEGIANLVADVLDRAMDISPAPLAALWADGGLSASRAFLQLQADISGRPLRAAHRSEATTLGVGALAAATGGLIESVDALLASDGGAPLIEPRPDRGDRAKARERHGQLVAMATDPTLIGFQ